MVYKKLEVFPPKKNCNFCLSRRSDEIELGEICNISDVYCHYFCLLLSNKVLQRGNDNQGILGFMGNDIKKEIARGKKLVCDYCKKVGATIECSDKKCRTKFHLPCGLKRNSLHQFFGHFRSYCSHHKPVQKIPSAVLSSTENCILCLAELHKTASVIWPECCKPSALTHRRCVQAMALNHGYYFKCPLCNDTKKFLEDVKRLGIYIPEKDPEWEREEGAFQDLVNRPLSCELGSDCLCDNGPNYSRIATKWKLERCVSCGSHNGIHLACSSSWVPGTGFSMPWKCGTCASAESAPSNPVSPANSEPDDDEEEMEIDVETIDHNPPLMVPEPYFRPYETFSLRNPAVERSDNVDCLKTELPIIISDSDDELDKLEDHDLEVLSISSTEGEALIPHPQQHRGIPATTISMPRPLLERAAKQKRRAPALQVSEIIELD